MSRSRIAIVGAGIVGCLVAREIVRRAPGTDVVLLDRDAVGSGASRRSAGLHFPRGASERVRRMSAYSEDWYARLAEAESDVPIHPLAMVVMASGHRADEVYDAYLPSAKLAEVTSTGHEDVQLPAGGVAWSGQGCQYADVQALAQHVERRLPATVRRLEGVAVSRLDASAAGVRILLGTGEELTVDQAVLAPGPWVADPAWRDLLAPHDLQVKRVVALHVDAPVDPHHGCVVLHDEDAFLLPLADRGHWLFSYTCQEWDADPDQAAPGLQQHQLAEARTILSRYAPALAARSAAGRVFCDAYTPDRQPLVRALDPAGRIVFAGGANGSGYRLAPAIAAEAVDQLDVRGTS